MDEQLKNNPEAGTAETESEEKETAKTYTEEELQMLLQKEGDRRIAQYQKTLEKKRLETEKFKSMNDEEKKMYELQKREQDLENREKQLAMLENKSAAIDVLADKGLDVRLVDFILDEDAEVMNNKIKLLEKAFKESVKKEVESRLASKSPKKALEGVTSYTPKDISKMSLADLQRLHNENPEAFNR